MSDLLVQVSKRFSSHRNLQWVETNPSNIRIFPTDIHFIAAWWFYADGFYGCSRMLYRFISSHPQTLLQKARVFVPHKASLMFENHVKSLSLSEGGLQLYSQIFKKLAKDEHPGLTNAVSVKKFCGTATSRRRRC
jgi:hypothetical protein